VRRLALAILVLLLAPLMAFAAPPPERLASLSRGINITGWFRFPASQDPAALRMWLGDAAMTDLKTAGFGFVRLAFDPALLDAPALRQVFLDQVRRLQRHGLAVIVSPHPNGWNIETNPAKLAAFWRDFAPALRGTEPALTFPEVLNEPVFHDDPAAWWRMQHELRAVIRAALPSHTIILTGQDWGSVAGLLTLPPEPDGNVVYSFHFYDPAELTSLAAYNPGLDRGALARLPFPETDRTLCEAAGGTADNATRGLIRFYCATNWDAARVRDRIQDAAVWARRNGVALIAGEFGASVMLNADARLAWLRLVRETFAADGIGWALWGYDDVMGLNVSRPPGLRPALDHSVLKALGLF
jgi:endoglucanase